MSVREWDKLTYQDPATLLMRLREFASTYPLHKLPYKEASLRTRELRRFGENRQCALFCYGMGLIHGFKVEYAHVEKSDYDCVARYEKNGSIIYVPVQMKELPPENLNPRVELQGELDKLRKYKDSKDLVVAFHINKTGTLRLSELDFSGLELGELWFFGANELDQVNWMIIGNLLRSDAKFYEFKYPGT